jgi:hypothetical protein
MNGLFTDLENPDFFRTYVTAHFERAPETVIADFPCDHTIDVKRVDVAYGDYRQKITEYSVLLHSANPDHYKRSGAMLHALCKSKIVVEVAFRDSKWGSMDDLESGTVLGVSFEHAQQMLKFPEFYKQFHNELLSFDLAYQLCAAYEDAPRNYDFSYLHNMCHYLCKNKDLTVDSFSMIFRSLMLRID